MNVNGTIQADTLQQLTPIAAGPEQKIEIKIAIKINE